VLVHKSLCPISSKQFNVPHEKTGEEKADRAQPERQERERALGQHGRVRRAQVLLFILPSVSTGTTAKISLARTTVDGIFFEVGLPD